MGILNDINDPKTWEAFYQYKCSKNYWTNKEEQDWNTFIVNKKYEVITNGLLTGEYLFTLPTKKLLNKMGSEKKRVVYTFNEAENKILKVLAWLLYRYDGQFPSNCYAFRKEMGAKQGLRKILRTKGLQNYYSYKVDIRDYFNSIPMDKALKILKSILSEDKELYYFLESIFTKDEAIFEGDLIKEKRGAMAGIPIASFIANIYLMDLDTYFENNEILYARYSDDIIFFANSQKQLEDYIKIVYTTFEKKCLKVNEDKVMLTKPGENWEFLGIAYHQGKIDLSRATKEKLKGKIRRKGRAIYRWKQRKNVNLEVALCMMNQVFNMKLYENPRHHELTWTRWFFPLITVDDGLKEIDNYMQDYLRYIETGRFNKKNYKVNYDILKKSGYRSLVHEYYSWKSCT